VSVIKAIGIFVIAGLCEIGDGYLVGLWLKEDKALPVKAFYITTPTLM